MSRGDAIRSGTGDVSPEIQHRDGHLSLLAFQNYFKNSFLSTRVVQLHQPDCDVHRLPSWQNGAFFSDKSLCFEAVAVKRIFH